MSKNMTSLYVWVGLYITCVRKYEGFKFLGEMLRLF